MLTYRVPMVPGPTSVPAEVLAAYGVDYAASDLEEEMFALYGRVEEQLRELLRSRNQMAIMTGEGMLALWAALKSCLKPGDRVLAISTGLFGSGIGDMARSAGASVETLEFEWDEVIDPNRVQEAIARFRPKMVTAVHCETPSGTLNPIPQVGELVALHGVPLFYVDAVSSAAGASLETDAWNIDLCLVGSQKCLSAPSALSVVSVSPRAWQIIDKVDYQGYDALKPWREALQKRYFPYTLYWHGMAALEVACRMILDEGLDAVVERHQTVARRCREGLKKLGLQLYPSQEQSSSPTVTAVRVPEGLSWGELDRRLRAQGVGVGGDYGPLAGKVFRLGHMGSQAKEELVDQLLEALAIALRGS